MLVRRQEVLHHIRVLVVIYVSINVVRVPYLVLVCIVVWLFQANQESKEIPLSSEERLVGCKNYCNPNISVFRGTS